MMKNQGKALLISVSLLLYYIFPEMSSLFQDKC